MNSRGVRSSSPFKLFREAVCAHAHPQRLFTKVYCTSCFSESRPLWLEELRLGGPAKPLPPGALFDADPLQDLAQNSPAALSLDLPSALRGRGT